jgi:hypothetical protein
MVVGVQVLNIPVVSGMGEQCLVDGMNILQAGVLVYPGQGNVILLEEMAVGTVVGWTAAFVFVGSTDNTWLYGTSHYFAPSLSAETLDLFIPVQEDAWLNYIAVQTVAHE